MRSRISTRACVLLSGAFVTAAAFVACAGDALGPDAGSVESVIVEPTVATVARGASLTLGAEVRNAKGDVVESARISWASADASIAEVSPDGVVTGRQIGTVLIAASSRGKDAFARITVNPTPVANIRLSVTNQAMMVGQTTQLTAEALDATGQVLSSRPISWTSSDAAVATVNQNGSVTALAVGAAIITASSEGRSAVATITVSLVPVARVDVTPVTQTLVAGQTTQLAAQVRDAGGAILTGRVITWSTNKASVATVTSEGLVTAVSSGSATITATSEGRAASVSIAVSPRPVSAVIVSPSQVALFAGQTVQLSALVTDDRAQVLNARPVTFSSSNNQVSTVSATGLVTGIGAGTATITATSEGATGKATVTIAPDPVAVVEVSPSSTNLVVGSTTQLSATPRSVTGQILTGRTISWSTSTPSVATVSPSGVVTALGAGNAVIIATAEGKQGSAAVSVRQVPVASVSVTPPNATIIVGQSVAFTATALDAAGNPLTGRVIGWTSSNNGIAFVSSSGLVTGIANGTATITASTEGKSATASVSVGPPPVGSVSVSPATLSLVSGKSATLAATVKDANGVLIGNAQLTWTTSKSSVATVNSNGVVTAVAAGTASITASTGGVTGSAAVTVTSPPQPVNRVVITPTSPKVKVGKTIQLSATAYDANDKVVTGVTFSWTSSNTSRATVSSTGLVSGVRNGNVTIKAEAGGKSGSVTVKVEG